MAASTSRCLSIVAGTLSAALWQHRSSELAGLIIELSTVIISEAEPEARKEALWALRAVAMSLVQGLASDSLTVLEVEDFQDSLAAALTFVSEHQAMTKEDGLDRYQHMAHQVLSWPRTASSIHRYSRRPLLAVPSSSTSEHRWMIYFTAFQ